MEHLVEQLFAHRRRELIEHVAGSVGEGATKSRYLLKLYGGIESDLIVSRCSRRGWSPCGRGSGGEALVPGRHPKRNLRIGTRCRDARPSIGDRYTVSCGGRLAANDSGRKSQS